MMMNSTTIDFCGELRRETERVYLVYDGDHETWIPKSQVESIRWIGVNR
jgi:hypothetical protein